MPIPTPFHERTQALCSSYRWKDWSGYCAVCSFDTSHEREYFAFRESAGLLDVTPLYKYEVSGPDAAADFNLDQMERVLIERAVKKYDGNISRAARELGLSRAALYRRMAKHDL